MSRFKAIGSSVYEKGDRIGCTPDEAAVELARKLNAYQMRVERLKTEVQHLMVFCNCTLIPNKELQAENARIKAEVERVGAENAHLHKGIYSLSLNVAQLKDEVERLTKAGDELWEFAKLADTNAPKARRKALKDWLAAKDGNPRA